MSASSCVRSRLFAVGTDTVTLEVFDTCGLPAKEHQ